MEYKIKIEIIELCTVKVEAQSIEDATEKAMTKYNLGYNRFEFESVKFTPIA